MFLLNSLPYRGTNPAYLSEDLASSRKLFWQGEKYKMAYFVRIVTNARCNSANYNRVMSLTGWIPSHTPSAYFCVTYTNRANGEKMSVSPTYPSILIDFDDNTRGD